MQLLGNVPGYLLGGIWWGRHFRSSYLIGAQNMAYSAAPDVETRASAIPIHSRASRQGQCVLVSQQRAPNLIHSSIVRCPPPIHHASSRPSHHVLVLVLLFNGSSSRQIHHTHRGAPPHPHPRNTRLSSHPPCHARPPRRPFPRHLPASRSRPRAHHVDRPARRRSAAGRLRLRVLAHGRLDCGVRDGQEQKAATRREEEGGGPRWAKLHCCTF